MRKFRITLSVEVFDTNEGPKQRATAEQITDYEGFKLPPEYFVYHAVARLQHAVCQQLNIVLGRELPPPPPTPPVRIMRDGDTSRLTPAQPRSDHEANQRLLDSVLRQHAGEWIAVRDGEILDADVDRSALRQRLLTSGRLEGALFVKLSTG